MVKNNYFIHQKLKSFKTFKNISQEIPFSKVYLKREIKKRDNDREF